MSDAPLDAAALGEDCSVCYVQTLSEALDSEQGLGGLDCCAHHFCFPCIKECSKRRSKCPLCVQTFTKIIRKRHVDGKLESKEFPLRSVARMPSLVCFYLSLIHI